MERYINYENSISEEHEKKEHLGLGRVSGKCLGLKLRCKSLSAMTAGTVFVDIFVSYK